MVAVLRVLAFSFMGAGYKVETGHCFAFTTKVENVVVLKKTFYTHFYFLVLSLNKDFSSQLVTQILYYL
jgi:hypothetical protein